MSNDAIDMQEVLERVQDDKELLMELLQIYCDDYVEKWKTFNEAVDKSDYEQLRTLSHSLKGASGNISAKKLRTSFLDLEEMAKQKDLSRAKEILKLIDQQFNELKEYIAANTLLP